MTPPTSPEHERPLPAARFVRLALAAILLLLSIGLLVAGRDAIQQQRVEMEWRAVRALGPFARESRGISRYQGVDAIRIGVGLIAVGVAFATWALSLLCLLIAGESAPGISRRALTGVLGWLSFLCLTVACGCFFPPWQVESRWVF
jgi:hypothetical protein